MATATVDTVLLNGSVGTGKSTTAAALGADLERHGIPGAIIDADELRRSWPSPPGDPFRSAVALANLRAVAGTFRESGARVLVVATVVETVDELRRTAEALGSESLLHVRLTVGHDAALSRLARRHDGDGAGLAWHIRRHPELAGILDRAGFTDDLVLDTTDRTTADVVRSITAMMLR